MQENTQVHSNGMGYSLLFSPAKRSPPSTLDFRLKKYPISYKDLFWADMQWRINEALVLTSRYNTIEKARIELAKVEMAKFRREKKLLDKPGKSGVIPTSEMDPSMIPFGSGILWR